MLKVAIDMPDSSPQNFNKYWIIGGLVLLAALIVLVVIFSGDGGGTGGRFRN
jgi:hypothetical protein